MHTCIHIHHPCDSHASCHSLKEDKHAMVRGIIEMVGTSGRQREHLEGRGYATVKEPLILSERTQPIPFREAM